MEKTAYNPSMNLYSPSGYAMPFELPEPCPLVITLGYGDQQHPVTGEKFFHHGVDFKVSPHTWLKALATGIVSGISTNNRKGFQITVNYRNYAAGDNSSFDVTYSHIREVVGGFGRNVKAGDNIAVCDGLLHVEVRFNGEEVNPLEFLTMVRDNLMMQEQKAMTGNNPEMATLDFPVSTPYDAQQPEIDQMYTRFFGRYMADLLSNRYRVPGSTETALRSVLAEGAAAGAYYEHAPSMLNPLGLGERSLGIIGRVQTLLIHDFLNYLALIHGVFLSSMTEIEKKAVDDAIDSQGFIDPFDGFDIDIQSFDIQRLVSVYPDKDGINWWTKAWFNGKKRGERAVEINRELAIRFIHDSIGKDEWLEEYYPRQMEVLHAALAQTREQVIKQLRQTFT